MSILVYWLFGGIRRAHPSHLAVKAEKVSVRGGAKALE
jgi:hypothetical protein